MRQQFHDNIRDQVKASYDAIAHEFQATRQKPWPEFHHFLAYVRHGAKVLDLGCGNGRLAGLLTAKEVDYLGVDHNSQLLEYAKVQHPHARFELADMVNADLPAGAFDTAFCVAAFHHVSGKKARKQVVLALHRALKDDGVLILTVWNLFQWKYAGVLFRAIFSFIFHLGLKYAWNDLWIKWGDYPIKRYYHAFLPKELLRYFSSDLWKIEDFYFTRKEKRVRFWRSFNLVLIAGKR